MKMNKFVEIAGALAAIWAAWRLYQANRHGVPWKLALRFPFVPIDQIDAVNRSGVGDTVRDELLRQMGAGAPRVTVNVRAAAAGLK